MRTSVSLDALLPKTRQVILGAILLDPDRRWYMRELARHVGLTVSSLQRQVLRRFENRIEWAFVFGSIARSEEHRGSDVDLMIIGHIGLAELSGSLRKAEAKIGHPVNPVIFSRRELTEKSSVSGTLRYARCDQRRSSFSEMPVSLTRLLGSKRLDRHVASGNEISALRKLVQRDLKGAGVSGLSADRVFATAYNAPLQLSKMALACAGYRESSSMVGHHQTTLEAARLVLGAGARKLTGYFETCRRRWHLIDYDATEVGTEAQPKELLEKAGEYEVFVEDWIAKNHPTHK
jgi:nucleotidyltransferase-like protein